MYTLSDKRSTVRGSAVEANRAPEPTGMFHGESEANGHSAALREGGGGSTSGKEHAERAMSAATTTRSPQSRLNRSDMKISDMPAPSCQPARRAGTSPSTAGIG